MHNTQRTQQVTDAAPEAVSLLDAIMEVGVRKSDTVPAAPSALDALVADTATVGKWSRGRKLVVRDVQVARQDSDSLCQGGLFGMVEESTEPVRALHATQIPMDAVEVERSKGCCVCGDGRCGIGPFIVTKGGK